MNNWQLVQLRQVGKFLSNQVCIDGWGVLTTWSTNLSTFRFAPSPGAEVTTWNSRKYNRFLCRLALSDSGIAMSWEVCAGAAVCSLGIAARYITTGIYSTSTPAGTRVRETTSAVCAPSESRSARASAITYLKRTWFQPVFTLDSVRSLRRSSNFHTIFALKILGTTLSCISTC